MSPMGHGRQAAEQDWYERVRHLQEDHKFRECNSSRELLRADSFRRHLRINHAALNGKWIELLESACMTVGESPQQPGK